MGAPVNPFGVLLCASPLLVTRPFAQRYSEGVGTKGGRVPRFGRVRYACGASNKQQLEERKENCADFACNM